MFLKVTQMFRKRWYVLVAAGLCAIYFYCSLDYSLPRFGEHRRLDVPSAPSVPLSNAIEDDDELLGSDIKNRTAIIEFLERKLQKALKWDKGTGCKIPKLDPYSDDMAWSYKKLGPLKCKGQDWVKCYHSKCRVVDSIRDTHTNIQCEYRDIIYKDDFHHDFGKPTVVKDGDVYQLSASDHVSVQCTGTVPSMRKTEKWSGNTLGFRPLSPPAKPLDDQINVMILAFDSTPRSGFIRLMPESWKVINEELKATVMEGYNILGDGTPACLFPFLTGKTELEHPDVRRTKTNNRTLDDFPFIFKHVKEEGYATAYIEDMPLDNTFTFRFNGFTKQPSDHYYRAFRNANKRLFKGWNFCYGDTPQFKIMMNLTEQFLEIEGRRFIFTFIGDISHDNFNYIQYADGDLAAFLRHMIKRTEDTLIIVMGDHGPRYAAVRKKHSLRGKLDERLPLLAIRLPDRLTRARPDALTALQTNSRVLTTAHDLHATILDAVGLRKHWNPYKVEGADLRRGLTWLEPIPNTRSCSEAGIETHWCTCLVWQNVSDSDPMYNRTANALINYINTFTKDAGPKCIPRTVASTSWVLRQRVNNRLLAFNTAIDYDTYLGRFNAKTKVTIENFQIGIESNPGGAVYEASLTYNVKDDKFIVQSRDISRVNAYRGESDCILDSHPHLAPYCYCKG
ncbi:uncharacterized protein LOC134751676 [Cydia strobilella]|uniref:uncharacterized protein LOC134751676 n=1 Tax=Cydia strobilella TaxID=1100964 RepID=UPI0030055517